MKVIKTYLPIFKGFYNTLYEPNELSDKNIKEIKKWLYDNLDDYKEYLSEQYTSFDGFISFHPNTFDGWLEITKDFNDYSENTHYLGSVLEFICYINEIDNDSMYNSLSSIDIYATNYNELTEQN